MNNFLESKKQEMLPQLMAALELCDKFFNWEDNGAIEDWVSLRESAKSATHWTLVQIKEATLAENDRLRAECDELLTNMDEIIRCMDGYATSPIERLREKSVIVSNIAYYALAKIKEKAR